jgi:hypothetical protein
MDVPEEVYAEYVKAYAEGQAGACEEIWQAVKCLGYPDWIWAQEEYVWYRESAQRFA